MSFEKAASTFKRLKPAFVLLAIVSSIGLWWAFRPEKLFVNQKVDEAAPAGIASMQPLFTGSLRSSTGDDTHGRVNILKNGSTFRLELSGFATKGMGPFTISLVRNGSEEADAKEIGVFSAGVNHQDFDLASGVSPDDGDAVLVTENDNHTLIAKATIEAF
ncbi:hypothetical protein [Edaphobacter aggregans]|uniref:hypothetical protein n=1 Tax=Edaphobacter aggregans TaxID=570835 RepID=UPI00055733FA|nr:hypothetical protein [Edaphobacter aggregans]